MTCAELITAISKHPPDAEVAIFYDTNCAVCRPIAVDVPSSSEMDHLWELRDGAVYAAIRTTR